MSVRYLTNSAINHGVSCILSFRAPTRNPAKAQIVMHSTLERGMAKNSTERYIFELVEKRETDVIEIFDKPKTEVFAIPS